MSNILLTKAEISTVVQAWVDEDWESRTISLNRGHWEDIAPVIAQEQLRNVVKWLDLPKNGYGYRLGGNRQIYPEKYQELRRLAGLEE